LGLVALGAAAGAAAASAIINVFETNIEMCVVSDLIRK
jgi:hypothetical protein